MTAGYVIYLQTLDQVPGGGQSTEVLQYAFGALYTERQQLLQSVEEWSFRKDNKNSVPGEVMHLNIITMPKCCDVTLLRLSSPVTMSHHCF